jgi:(5-formylfuran-3-yl)methyl phosphate synthase
LVLLLASVADAGEAATAVAGGADIIDCKNPSRGVVGAVVDAEIEAIVAAVGGRRTVSATIGDLPVRPEIVCPAVAAKAATGVDLVKLAFFPDGAPRETIAALAAMPLPGVRLVGMLLADRAPNLALLPLMARAGFAGAMLDTVDKGGGGLLAAQSVPVLRRFVDTARDCGLFAGLAGSLRAADIPVLVDLAPDLMGFRGALCLGDQRTARIDAPRLRAIRELMPDAGRSATIGLMPRFSVGTIAWSDPR